MKRVQAGGQWTLFSPNDVADLHDLYGKAFEERYQEYEKLAAEGKLRHKTVEAATLWRKMITMLFETGHPWITFKDPSNVRSPQSHVGVPARHFCFPGETIVAVADGRNGVTIAQLAAESGGNNRFPVYSARKTKRRHRGIRGHPGYAQKCEYWVPVIGSAVAYEAGKKELVKVTLDDGSFFRCTADQQIALKDGGYMLALDLQPGQSLAPFNSTTQGEGHSKYRHINSTTSNKQHILLWEFHRGKRPKGFHVDHIVSGGGDHIENLQLLSTKQHWQKTAEERKGAGNPIHRVRDKNRWRQRTSVSSTKERNGRWSGISDETLIQLGQAFVAVCGELTPNAWFAHSKILGLPQNFSKNRFGGKFSNFKSLVIGNHKVSKLELTGEVEPVYDLIVENNNFYIITSGDSKFLHSSGVLVHDGTPPPPEMQDWWP
jgi:hypothetical protein